jgi:hypothetical protein
MNYVYMNPVVETCYVKSKHTPSFSFRVIDLVSWEDVQPMQIHGVLTSRPLKVEKYGDTNMDGERRRLQPVHEDLGWPHLRVPVIRKL